jgi:hypothetical protein
MGKALRISKMQFLALVLLILAFIILVLFMFHGMSLSIWHTLFSSQPGIISRWH